MRHLGRLISAVGMVFAALVTACGTPTRSVQSDGSPSPPTACTVQAAGSPDAANASGKAAPPDASFPPAEVAAPTGSSPMTSHQALDSALSFGTSDQGPLPSSAATAEETSYQSAQTSLGETMDPRIAPNRCVWSVTVDATYAGPPGAMPTPLSTPDTTVAPPTSYSVVYDVNSNFLLEIRPHSQP